MTGPDPAGAGEDPAAALTRYGAELADRLEEALPGWVVAAVDRVMTAWAGSVPAEVTEAAAEAGRRAGAELGPVLRDLLGADIDAQTTTPLAVVRGAVRYPTEVLRAAGVPAVARDRFAEAAFPEDRYDLSPASLADIAPDLADLGLAWGAAKAFVHKARHRR